MRLFLALELPEEVRRTLGELVARLSERRGWRWADPAGLHLTLRFLGEVSEEGDRRARPLWRRCASAGAPLSLRTAGLGLFPGRRRPRVLWTGVEEAPPGGRLAALSAALEAAAREAGFPGEDRPFRPHLTLARARGDGPPEPPGEDEAGVEASFEVRELSLVRSHLRPGRALHETLERFPLGGP